ncbi:hypothetical protein [Parvularcula lutaonensis]|uniref:hypothetical protein n=1 Tax=Parvularcula lutaonensis TaxID=491923 RepID=UPI001676647A|nr:hypothetical protein [Parvularcula lutaonensis]
MVRIFRFVSLGVLALAVTGCASVELSMPTLPGGFGAEKVAENDASTRQREELVDALERLEQRPWTPVSDSDDGIVTLLFGGAGPSPQAQAEAYLTALEGQPITVVRRDVEATLAAAWNVAHEGKDAVRAMQPLPSDLRTIESAIVEARQCRLVYAEALSMIAKNGGNVSRDEIRRVKEQFNQAILELGRTADAIQVRLDGEPVNSYAGNQTAF